MFRFKNTPSWREAGWGVPVYNIVYNIHFQGCALRVTRTLAFANPRRNRSQKYLPFAELKTAPNGKGLRIYCKPWLIPGTGIVVLKSCTTAFQYSRLVTVRTFWQFRANGRRSPVFYPYNNMHPSLLISVEKNVFSHVLHKTKLQIFLAFPISQALLRTNLVGNIMTVWCSHHSPNGHYIPDGSGAAVLGINSFRSLADIRKACVCLPALRELRTYDVVFSNDAWRTPPDATALPMAALVTLPHLGQISFLYFMI